MTDVGILEPTTGKNWTRKLRTFIEKRKAGKAVCLVNPLTVDMRSEVARAKRREAEAYRSHSIIRSSR